MQRQFNLIKEVLKNNVPFQDFKDFVIGEMLPIIDAKEGSEEVVSYVIDNIQKKYSGKLVSFDIIQEEMLAGDYIETCESVIKNDRLNPNFDGDDTSDYEEVDFGEELKACIISGDFKTSYQDCFEDFSFVNIQL